MAAVPSLFRGQGSCSLPVSGGFPCAAVLRVLTALFTLGYADILEINSIRQDQGSGLHSLSLEEVVRRVF